MRNSFGVNFREWVPIVKPFPIKSFPRRLKAKLYGVLRNIYGLLCSSTGLSGARVIGTAPNGNSLLRLNKRYPLGDKGKVIQIPRDLVIFEHLRLYGKWEIEESVFLAGALKRLVNQAGVVFIDIGANVGIVTLQTIAMAKTSARVVMVEPIPSHVEAINYNVTDLEKTNETDIFPFALGKQNKKVEIFTEDANHGNTSLIASVVPKKDVIKTEITMKKTTDFVEEVLRGDSHYVIKSDLQGFDAIVLAKIPVDIWEKTEAAVIEVWAVDGIDQTDVERCLTLWKNFRFIGWSTDSKTSIQLGEIRDFWLGKSGESRNLFLSK